MLEQADKKKAMRRGADQMESLLRVRAVPLRLGRIFVKTCVTTERRTSVGNSRRGKTLFCSEEGLEIAKLRDAI